MQVNITQAALLRLKILNKDKCLIEVRKGGCFGYFAVVTFDFTQPLQNLLLDIDGVKIYGLDHYNLDTMYTLDYVNSLVKSCFEVVTSLTGCCCNKSFGGKIQVNQCIGT